MYVDVNSCLDLGNLHTVSHNSYTNIKLSEQIWYPKDYIWDKEFSNTCLKF